jgi:hypothetical protein
MFGSVNIPFLPKPANTASLGKLAKARRQIRRTADYRPPAFGGQLRPACGPDRQGRLRKSLPRSTNGRFRLTPEAA